MVRPSGQTSLIDQQHIVLDNVSWDFYEHLLQEVGDRPIRITYDSGDLEITAPLQIHEVWKKRIGALIDIMCLERDIKVVPAGSTTFRMRQKEKGLELDECYYIQHAEWARIEKEPDLSTDPPPDLAIEIDITSRSIKREPIYAALGIPELWRFDGEQLVVLKLGKNGQYTSQSKSDAFPFLPIDKLNGFLRRFINEDHNTVVRAFRDWVIGLK
jgi:Uma2 family endonuclease